MKSSTRYFIYSNGVVIRAINHNAWLAWMKHVGMPTTVIRNAKIGNFRILTFFNGRVTSPDSPKPFVTCVYGNETECVSRRYYQTEEEAVTGHLEIVESIHLRSNQCG